MVRALLCSGVLMRLLVLVPLLAGCSTYAQHRAALVPHATPLPTDGQPLAAPAEISIGADNLVDLAAPHLGNPDAGVVVPKQQLRGQALFRVAPNLSIGAVYEQGIRQNATRVSSTVPPIDEGTLAGPGVQMAYSLPTGTPGFRVGFATEIVFWNIPWVEYTSCIDNCFGGPYTYSQRDSTVIPTAAFAIVPSYRTGALTLFGGLTARNHPTITEKVITTIPDSNGDVDSGPYNLTAHAGVAVELGGGVRASVFVHQTLTSDPVAYGPGLGMLLSIPLGHDAPPPPAPAPAPHYGPPGATL